MKESKQSQPVQSKTFQLRRPELLLCVLIVLATGLVAGLVFPEPNQGDRVAFSLVSAMLGGLIAALGLTLLLYFWQVMRHTQGTKTYILPVGHAAVISRHGRRVSVTQGPEVKLNENNGESMQLFDMRERSTDLSHKCKSLDRKDVTLSGCVLWRISNVETYLDRAQKPDELMTRIIDAATMVVVGRYEIKPLAARFESLSYEIAAIARERISGYGIGLISIMFTASDLQGSNKSPAEEEAERLRKIGDVAKDVGERTLEHVEKIEQARSGKSS